MSAATALSRASTSSPGNNGIVSLAPPRAQTGFKWIASDSGNLPGGREQARRFSLKSWNGSTLQVASQTVLLGQKNPWMQLLPTSPSEIFSWDIHMGTVVPMSKALQDPVSYYCKGLLGNRGGKVSSVLFVASSYLAVSKKG